MTYLINWLAMGGYAAYVWSAYGIVGLVFIVQVLANKRHQRQTRRLLRHWLKQAS